MAIAISSSIAGQIKSLKEVKLVFEMCIQRGWQCTALSFRCSAQDIAQFTLGAFSTMRPYRIQSCAHFSNRSLALTDVFVYDSAKVDNIERLG